MTLQQQEPLASLQQQKPLVPPQLLRALLEGHYICRIRFPDEFDILQDEHKRSLVNAWLGHLNMRLASIGEGEDRVFFMAFIGKDPDVIEMVKKELREFRDTYGPIVQMLDLIRQAGQNRYALGPGEYIALYELESAVAQSSVLQTRLQSMYGIIKNASPTRSHRENLRSMLEQLVKEGYAIQVNKNLGNYRITGKIEQLYAVLQFLDENQVIPDETVNDQDDLESEDLFKNAGEE